MAVPANLAALSTTASLNSPAGTDSVFPELDDFIRAYGSFIAQLRDEKFPYAGGTLTGNVSIQPLVGGGTVRYRVTNPGSGAGVFASYLMQTGAMTWDVGTEGNGRFYVYNGIRDSITIPSTGEVQLYKPFRLDAATTANELVRKQEMDAAVASAGFQARKMVTITANGTYTPTGDPTKFLGAMVYVVGGGGQGGGGGSAGGANSGGGGGGGGGTAIGWITSAQIGAGVAVTIGAGGTAGGSADAIGGAGGNTSFGAFLIGGNGGGGRPGGAAGGPGGDGGSASGSALQTSIRGSDGGSGSAFSVGAPGSGGAGGSSSRGGGGAGGQGGFAPAALAASSYGGGGGGSGIFSSGAAAGAPGVVVVDEHYRA